MQPLSFLAILAVVATTTSASQLRNPSDAVATDVAPAFNALSDNVTHAERRLAYSELCVVEVINVDLYGNDVGSAPGNVWQDCWVPCARNGDCKQITFNPNTKTCWLKKAGTMGVRSVGMTSAVVLRQTLGVPCRVSNVPIKDVDYYGADISNKWTADASQCFEYCRELYNDGKMCRLYTWNPNTKQCYAKREFGAELRDSPGVTSGVLGIASREAVYY